MITGLNHSIDPEDLDGAYIRAGHARQNGEGATRPGLPINTPSAPMTVTDAGADGARPIEAIRVDGKPDTPLNPVPVVVPTMPTNPNPFSSLRTPPQGVAVNHVNLAGAAAPHQQTVLAQTTPRTAVPIRPTVRKPAPINVTQRDRGSR
jgi:hypothetical protein